MYDQGGTENHSREDESELLCNVVAKKAIPTNGKLCRFEEIKLRPRTTSACEETRKLFKAGAALYFCKSVL